MTTAIIIVLLFLILVTLPGGAEVFMKFLGLAFIGFFAFLIYLVAQGS